MTAANTKIKVLLIDDSSVFVQALVAFLQRHDDLLIVGTGNNAEQGLALAQQLSPDLVLLDLAMPDVLGLELIPRLRQMLPEAHIIILTLLGYREVALAAGADEYFTKDQLGTELIPAIRRVMA
jgi:two-component system nitrate/nitrite response regulator NarL